MTAVPKKCRTCNISANHHAPIGIANAGMSNVTSMTFMVPDTAMIRKNTT